MHRHKWLVGAGALLAVLGIWVTLRLAGSSGPSDIVFRRKPYLQNGQQSRITICWETDEPTRGRLRVVDSSDRAVFEKRTRSAGRHEVVIDGLEAGQSYRYFGGLSGI